MEGIRKQPRRFGLGHAIGLSVLVHLILWLLLQFAPEGLFIRASVIPPEAGEIRFTFAPVEPGEPTEGEVKGVVPIDMPDANSPVIPETTPSVSMKPHLVEMAGDDVEVLGGIEAPVPEPFQPAERVERSLEPPVEQQATDAEPGDDLEDAAETADLAPGDDAGFRSGPAADEGRAEGRGVPRGSLRESVREFGRALARSGVQAPVRAEANPRLVRMQPPSLPTPGHAEGILEFESGDYDWQDYGRQIHAALIRAWYRRLDAGVGGFEQWAKLQQRWRLEDQARFRFVIERNGDVSGITLEDPSDCGPLDASARAALQDLILPPLPSDFPRDREGVHVRFIALVDILARVQVVDTDSTGRRVGSHVETVLPMRRYLNALERLGYF